MGLVFVGWVKHSEPQHFSVGRKFQKRWGFGEDYRLRYSLRQLEDAIRNEDHQLKERLFQLSLLLKDTALHLILAGMILVAIVSPRKVLIERMSLGGITLGLVFLCQPFWLLLYQTGFQILLGGLTAFIVVAHR